MHFASYQVCLLASTLVLSACAAHRFEPDTRSHLSRAQLRTPAAQQGASAPAETAQAKTHQEETYSLSVQQVDVQSLLQAIARDAQLDIDIHPAVRGQVTLTAHKQTLPQLLTRISRQVDMQHEILDRTLLITPDWPFIRHYTLDYVNLARETSSTVSVSSQIGATGAPAKNTQSNTNTGSGSTARIQSNSPNHFWANLTRNLADLLKSTEVLASSRATPCESSPGSRAAVTTTPAHSCVDPITRTALMVSPETGTVTVRANAYQHARVNEFLQRIQQSAHRQVLIEATIAEVALTRNYQQGIDWSALNLFDTGLKIVQRTVGAFATSNASPALELEYASSGGNFSGAVKLLETFGTVRILSSPKLAVLNNQTAVMKVVDDNIYFTYEIKETDATSNSPGRTTIQSTLHSVPVGLVLTITPMVGSDGFVTLNLRPSMSRVVGHKTDPSLQFVHGSDAITNTIPIIRAREFDSVMRIGDGSIAIMGGLMEDGIHDTSSGIPGLSALPGIGRLFESRNDNRNKTELVIFVRPTVIPDSGLASAPLPDQDYFRAAPAAGGRGTWN